MKDIDLKIRRGEFICIIGEIGSGKSSLIHQLVGQLLYIPQKEIDFVGGIDAMINKSELLALKQAILDTVISEDEAPIKMSGEMSYVGDDCWIQNTTVRENILFGLELNKKRYVKVCLAC